MKVTVDRSKWSGYRATRVGGEPTHLYSRRHDDFCCLGFMCNQIGIDEEELVDKGEPDELGKDLSEYGLTVTVEEDAGYSSEIASATFVNRAVTINDGSLPLDDKEELLTFLFAEHGHELIFTGEYPNEHPTPST